MPSYTFFVKSPFSLVHPTKEKRNVTQHKKDIILFIIAPLINQIIFDNWNSIDYILNLHHYFLKINTLVQLYL